MAGIVTTQRVGSNYDDFVAAWRQNAIDEEAYRRYMMTDPVISLQSVMDVMGFSQGEQEALMREAVNYPIQGTSPLETIQAQFAKVVNPKKKVGYTYKWADGTYHHEPEPVSDEVVPEPSDGDDYDPGIFGGLRYYVSNANVDAEANQFVARELTLEDLEKAMEMMSEPNRNYIAKQEQERILRGG